MRPLRILNVAEKNDAAKELSRIMSRGQSLRVGIELIQASKTSWKMLIALYILIKLRLHVSLILNIIVLM